jgi:hypothetical protein
MRTVPLAYRVSTLIHELSVTPLLRLANRSLTSLLSAPFLTYSSFSSTPMLTPPTTFVTFYVCTATFDRLSFMGFNVRQRYVVGW